MSASDACNINCASACDETSWLVISPTRKGHRPDLCVALWIVAARLWSIMVTCMTHHYRAISKRTFLCGSPEHQVPGIIQASDSEYMALTILDRRRDRRIGSCKHLHTFVIVICHSSQPQRKHFQMDATALKANADPCHPIISAHTSHLDQFQVARVCIPAIWAGWHPLPKVFVIKMPKGPTAKANRAHTRGMQPLT